MPQSLFHNTKRRAGRGYEMPVGVRITYSPAIQHLTEFRRMIRNHVEKSQASGERINLTERLWSRGGPSFSTVSIRETLSAQLETRAKMQEGAEFSVNMFALSKVLRSPIDLGVVEIVAGPGPSSAPPNFWIRARLHPNVGAPNDMRNHLKAYVEERNNSGGKVMLAEDVWGEAGAAFTVQTGYDSIDDAYAYRAESMNDPAFQQFTKDLFPLMARPAEWSVHQVLMRMPQGG